MEITKDHRIAITQNKDATFLREISLQNGMTELSTECRKLVLQGVTTIEEMIDIAGLNH